VKLTDHNRTEKRRLNLIDAGNESLLPGEPPDREANSTGNRKWRQQDAYERSEDDHQDDQKNSILKRHRGETKNS
jgi:hypothetical protein